MGLIGRATQIVSSPDGNVTATIDTANGNLVYSVIYRGAQVVENSPLGLTVNSVNLGVGATITGSCNYTTNETFVSRSGIHKLATNWYSGQVVAMLHPASATRYNLDLRVYNNGVAFRFELDGNASKTIMADASGFTIPSGSMVYYQSATSTYETYYRGTNISLLPANVTMGPPVTIQLAGTNGFLVLTESSLGIFGNPYLTKSTGGSGRQLSIVYPVNQNGSTGVSVTGPIDTPWNLIMIGDDLNMILNNDMVESLAPPPSVTLFPGGAASWATSGRSVWDWLQPQPGGITYTNAMTNSLWASRLGFEYNTVDAGWSSWNGGNPWPQVQQVVNYSHALGVKVLLWVGSSELASQSQRTSFFQQLQTYGVDGFKADFFDFNSVSAAASERVQLRQSILQEAAEHHLAANFHGTAKPTGEFRTYPNLIQTEGVFGKEQYPNPWMVVSLPLTRFMAGPADYTPLDFGGNIAFEIANVINMPGPIITYCERPDRIANSPFASLIRTIPSQWDETVVLPQSELGKTTASARRKGTTWYLGIMNAIVSRSWNMPLAFLESNVTYQADIVRQDSTSLERTHVTRDTVLAVTITSTNGSGFVAKLYPLPAFSISSNYKLNGTIIGTSGSWSNSGNTREKVFDNNLGTFFDAPDNTGDWAGLDLGAGNRNIVSMIRYCPRAGWSGRMVPGIFQGANAADFSDATDLCTVGYAPPEGDFTTVTLTNQTVFRYVRYLSPPDGWCNIGEVQFYGGTNPPAPANIAASPGTSQVVLNWDTAGNVTYNISRSTNSGGIYTLVATNLSAATFVDFNVVNGETYFYVVKAVSPVGLMSTDSVAVSALPVGPPQAPSDLSAVPMTNHTVRLVWNTTPSASGYVVKRSLINGGPYSVIANSATTNFTDAGLINGVAYHYCVSATNAIGTGPNSAEATACPGGVTSWMLEMNPAGYWPLNETDGNKATDISGHGNDGLYQPLVNPGLSGVPNPPFAGFPPNGPATGFAGQRDSWISLPALNLNSGNVTFTAWLYPTATTQASAAGLVFCRDGIGTVSGFGYNPTGTQLGYTWNNDSGTYGWNSGLTPPAWQWSFVALVVTGTNATIYLCNTNGQSSAGITHGHVPSAFAGETRIGNDSFDPARTFNGRLAHVAVYNHALATNEISALYKAGSEFSYARVLANSFGNGCLVLSWPFGARLLEATNLNGPWNTNSTVPPAVVAPVWPQLFYRLQ